MVRKGITGGQYTINHNVSIHCHRGKGTCIEILNVSSVYYIIVFVGIYLYKTLYKLTFLPCIMKLDTSVTLAGIK